MFTKRIQSGRCARLMLAGLLLALTALPLAQPSAAAQPLSPEATPPLPAGWWAAVQQEIQSSEYHVTWQSPTHLPGVPGAYQAPNRAHNLRTYFTETGLRIIPRTGAETWGLSLRLPGAEPVAPKVAAHHVTYRRDALAERYANTPEGLEQRLTLNEPATEVAIAFGGDLRPVLRDGAVELLDAAGAAVLRYADLRAVDDAGREVPLDPGISPEGAQFVFRAALDAQDAVFPLTFSARITRLADDAAWHVDGDQADAGMGFAVGTAGDVNGDGYSDVIVGAPYYDRGEDGEGRAFVYHGSASGPSATADWDAEGNLAGAQFGFAAATAGDVNGDGYSDVIVGAPYYTDDQTAEGRVFVYHGSAAGLSAAANWNADGDAADANFGFAVGTAGYVKSSQYTGVIVGAPGYDSDNGRAYVYYGSASGVSSTGFWYVEGAQITDGVGAAVGTAGNVNGDGYDDVIVGAPLSSNGQSEEGVAMIYAGAAGGLGSSPLVLVESDVADAHLGAAVGTAGDVNGDGYADVIVGAPELSDGNTGEGAAYVYYGAAGTSMDDTADWSQQGESDNALYGAAVGTAGDVDGDGCADVIVGAPGYGDVAGVGGKAFVYHGSVDGLSTTFAWDAQVDQTGAQYGASVGTAGDVNGDGFSDAIVGAPGYTDDQTNEGRAFVYYGAADTLADVEDWTKSGAQAGEQYGAAIAAAGDVNGDGYGDVIVGAPGYDGGNTNQGRVFVYHGADTGLSTSANWSYTLPSPADGDQFGAAVGAAGDLDGDGYGDVLVGSPGHASAAPQAGEGWIFAFFGGADGLGSIYRWHAQSNQPAGSLGTSVGTAGDVNGDGYSDIIAGAPFQTNPEPQEGRAYVWLGSAGIRGSEGTPGNAAWQAEPDAAYAYFGTASGTAGDVNGDGYSDVIVGASEYNAFTNDTGRGAIYLYYGHAGGLSSTPQVIDGDQDDACFGEAVGTAGDVNGDGYADVVVGAPFYDDGGTDAGRVYVYYGSADGVDPVSSWFVDGELSLQTLGEGVGTAGDVNGDGYADVIVGGSGPYVSDPTLEYGKVYVYYGAAAGLSSVAAWTQTYGAVNAGFGAVVGTAGDVNGDGYADVVLGAPDANEVFCYYGNGGDGLALRPIQRRLDGGPLAPLGIVDADTSVLLGLRALLPLGRDLVKLQWQAAPLGQDFDGVAVVAGTDGAWQASGQPLTRTVAALTPGVPYHWRVRLLYRPGNAMGLPASRWLHVPGPDALATDFRTDDGTITGLAATNDSPTVIGNATAFTATADPVYVSYTWDFTQGATASGPVVTYTFPATGIYTVLVTATNAVDEASVSTLVTVTDQPIAGLALANSSPTPGGSPTAFTATVSAGTGVAYTWNFGDGSPVTGGNATVQHTYDTEGVYTAIVTATNTANAMSASTLVTITAVPISGLVAHNDGPTALGDITTLTAEVAAGSGVQYDWNFGDGSPVALDAGKEVQHIYPAEGSYTALVTATNSLNSLSASTPVSITAAEAITGLSATNDSPTPFAAPTTLTATVTGGSGVTYTWNFGDGSPVRVPGVWPGSGAVVQHVYPSVGSYTAIVTATNRLGQLSTSTVVTVTEVAIDGLQAANDGPTPLGRTTTLSATITAGSNVTYVWAFGDGAVGAGALATHVYPAEGLYTATVTATNSLGQAVAETYVTIVPGVDLYLPLVLRQAP